MVDGKKLGLGAGLVKCTKVTLCYSIEGDNPRCGGDDDDDDDDECDLKTSFYVKIVWTSLAEFPGILFHTFLSKFHAVVIAA